jgi:hypothetical protein
MAGDRRGAARPRAPHRARSEEPFPEGGRREDEDERAGETQVGEERIHVPEDALANALDDDLAIDLDNRHDVADDLIVHGAPGRGHFAHHHGEEERPRRGQRGHGVGEAPEALARGGARGPHRLEPLAKLPETGREDLPVETGLAAEVIVDHRLGDAGADRDFLDPRAAETAFGEEARGRGDERLAGGRRVVAPSRRRGGGHGRAHAEHLFELNIWLV